LKHDKKYGFDAIVIGASAGGLYVMINILKPLPVNYPIPIIVVQHRAKDERSLLEEVDSVRYRLYREMDQRIVDASPVVPLWYDEVVHLINPRVKGFDPNALNLLELRRVRK